MKTYEEWLEKTGRHTRNVGAIELAKAAWQACDAEYQPSQQRQMDLIRYARHFLHDEGCISDEEYAEIVQDSDGRVKRLESYDGERKRLTEALKHLRAILDEAQKLGLKWPSVESALATLGRDGAAEYQSQLNALKLNLASVMKRSEDLQVIIDEARKLADELNVAASVLDSKVLSRIVGSLRAVLDRSGARGGSVAASPAPLPDNPPTTTDRSCT